MRINFFLKIFIGFWLLCITILGSWLLVAQYFDSLPQFEQQVQSRTPPPRFMLRLMYELENKDAAELPGVIQRLRDKRDIELFLINPNGEEIYQRRLGKKVKAIVRQLKDKRRRAVLHTDHSVLLGQAIYRTDLGPLYAVAQFHRPPPSFLQALNSHLWLRLALAVIISGAICYWLSRVITRRLQRVQMAARQLADGDLATRIPVRHRSKDESDELAIDFNRMAQQLENMINAKSRLLSDVSHELRSPLARLRIALALAEEDPVQLDTHLQRIDKEALRLEELIAQLLSSQAQPPSMEDHLDLLPLLAGLCADAKFEAAAQGKDVVLNSALEQAVVSSSGDLLKKSFENILRNAIKYTADNSEVSVQLTADENNYQIEIDDRGPGLPEAELDNIFREFYRVDTARPRETGGYGLGLAIAKRSVEMHKGSIRAENTEQGLRVIVLLPRTDDEGLL